MTLQKNASWHKKHMKKIAKDKQRRKMKHGTKRPEFKSPVEVASQHEFIRDNQDLNVRKRALAKQTFEYLPFYSRIWLRLTHLKTTFRIGDFIRKIYKKIIRPFQKESESDKELKNNPNVKYVDPHKTKKNSGQKTE